MAEQRKKDEAPTLTWRNVAPVAQSVVQAAVPTPAPAPAPAPRPTPSNPNLYREAPPYDYAKARESMTRAAINMLTGNSPLPQAYRSKVAVNAPNRAQMMAQNLQMERDNKQPDFYDRMQQVGFVSRNILKEALADRRAARTLAANSVGEAGRQAGQARQQAIDEARLMENASQAEYASRWKRPEMDMNMAKALMQGANQMGQIDTQRLRNEVVGKIAQGELDQQSLNDLLTFLKPDGPATQYAGDPEMMQLILRDWVSNWAEESGYADGGMVDIHTYADGGEVEVEAPTEEGKLAGLDTGDYVFPVEAVRFYGTKTIKAMIEKAMMAADD